MSHKTDKQSKKVKTVTELYIHEASREPLLTAEEEIELSKRIETGDKEARKKLVVSNLRLVISLAKPYALKSLNYTLLGLIQEGNIGLMRAAEKFDWRLGNRFSTYATEWIEGRIRNVLRLERRNRVEKISLDDAVGSEKTSTRHDFIEDEKAVSPSASVNTLFLQEIFAESILQLEPREQQIIKWSFGLVDGITRNTKEIAKLLGLRRAVVKQAKDKALRKLKQHAKIKKLKPGPTK